MSETIDNAASAAGAAEPGGATAGDAPPSPPAEPSWLYTHAGWQARPKQVPQKYWDDDKRGVALDRLLKGAADTQKALKDAQKQADDLKTRQMVAPESYAVNIPPDSVLAAQGVQPDHLLVQVVGEKLKAVNAPQAVMDAVIAGYAEFFTKAQAAQLARLPEAADPVAGGEKVVARLDALDQRMQAAATALAKGDQARTQALLGTLRTLTLTAEGVELAEMALNGQLAQVTAPYAASPASGAAGAGGTRPTIDDAKKLMATPEYRDGDPQTHAKVRSIFAELTKNDPPPAGANPSWGAR